MRSLAVWLALLFTFSTGCGGHSNLSPSTNVSGSYEFVVTSNVTGGVTLAEANLTGSGNQSLANGPSQVQILTLENKTWYVNGVCPGSTPGNNGVAATFHGNSVGVAFNEGGNVLTSQGTLTGTTITGNYSVSGSTCPDLQGSILYPPGFDSGGYVANQVPALAGTFLGTLNLPDGTDNASLTLAEKTDHSLTVTLQLTGNVDNGTYALTGSSVGNVMFVSGSVNGNTLNLFGYFDRSGTYTKLPNSLLVFDYNTQAKAGLLLGQ